MRLKSVQVDAKNETVDAEKAKEDVEKHGGIDKAYTSYPSPGTSWPGNSWPGTFWGTFCPGSHLA